MARTIVCDVAALTQADLDAIELLARLQLVAKRHGYQLRLRDVSRELEDLIVFVGLDPVLPVEPGRQPEEREQAVGIEEERQLPDSPV
jgi:ABC-type transporter Mla MlaB component